jgi:NAD(P)-dependent dehydrogenase (short-subunit alcohol dehydrogenase family)
MSNPFSYEGKRVVVTGAATGVGAALLDVLDNQGVAHVTVVDIKQPSGRCDSFIEANLATASGVAEATAGIGDHVAVLFNNAGVADTQPPQVVLGVNFLALRALSESLLDRIPDGGAIVNTASTAGGGWLERTAKYSEVFDIADWDAALAWFDDELAGLGQPTYFVSKECVQMYTAKSSRPTIRRGVRTNSVCPSPIDTPLIADFRATMTDKVIDWNLTETNGRMVTAHEVATVLAFLGSDAAAYVNGVNLNVDAGFNAAMATGQVDFSGLFA